MRLCGISSCFQLLSPCIRQVAHALLTRPPLEYDFFHSASSSSDVLSPFDLHVLSTPPAFILSQDQTLNVSSFFPAGFPSGLSLFYCFWFRFRCSLPLLPHSGCFPSGPPAQVPFSFLFPFRFWNSFPLSLNALLRLLSSLLPLMPSSLRSPKLLFLEFSGLHCCLFVKVQHISLVRTELLYITMKFYPCQELF